MITIYVAVSNNFTSSITLQLAYNSRTAIDSTFNIFPNIVNLQPQQSMTIPVHNFNPSSYPIGKSTIDISALGIAVEQSNSGAAEFWTDGLPVTVFVFTRVQTYPYSSSTSTFAAYSGSGPNQLCWSNPLYLMSNPIGSRKLASSGSFPTLVIFFNYGVLLFLLWMLLLDFIFFS